MNIIEAYQPTATEKFLSDYLISKNILEPWDLNIETLLSKLNLFVLRGDISLALHDYGGIVLAHGLKKDTFIEKFHHELIHILCHAGNQQHMQQSLIDRQEVQAKRNLIYTAIPYHMLKYIDFGSDTISNDILELFPSATKSIINNRMLIIRDQLIQTHPALVCN